MAHPHPEIPKVPPPPGSEPIQVRGKIVKYFVVQTFLLHIRLLNFPQCLVGLVVGEVNKLVTGK